MALDLKKAFDTVDHETLIKKLRHYGFKDKSNDWFKNYLSDRKQIACINGNLSEPLVMKTGVPQGSILGPLLFILYVNDLSVCLKKSVVNMYADDTIFYYAHRTPDEVSKVLQDDLHNVAQWLNANKLSLHLGKTNCMLITTSQKRHSLNDTTLGLSLDGSQIAQTENCKYLGVCIDQDLRFDMQVDAAIAGLKRALGIFSRAAQFLHAETKILLYNTIILPHIDYCSTVWGSSPHKKDLVRLQRIQNRAMRIILQCHHRTHVLDVLKALKWMSIKQRLLYNLYILLWKIVNNRVPDYLSHIFTPVSHMHNYNTRSSTTGNFFMHRTSQKSLSYLGAKYWNQLPQHIRD